jgi:photosystem II stability/assembly factor-like uncharacterized protein
MAIALSHGGPTIYSASMPSREVLVGTARGIARLERSGNGWRLAGTWLGDLHISAILIEPRSGAIFAGGYEAGSLHVSRDGGETWQPSDRGLSESNVYSLEAVVVDGRTRLYCGTEPAKLFVSDDLGASWSEYPGLREVPTVDSWSFPGPPHVAHLKHLTFDPRDAGTVYASIEVGGLLRSLDGGTTWQDVPGMYEDVHRLVIHPREPRRMYVAGGNGLYVSEDEGASWRQWTGRDHAIGGYPDQLVLRPSDPEVMFVAAAADGPGAWRRTRHAGARVCRSRDGGRTWEVLSNGISGSLQGNIEAMCLEDCGTSCSLFAATTAGEVFASDDAGDSWQLIAAGLAPISKGGHYHALAATPA